MHMFLLKFNVLSTFNIYIWVSYFYVFIKNRNKYIITVIEIKWSPHARLAPSCGDKAQRRH